MTRIPVDPGRSIGHLDRNVFGGFIEHLGRCIYGGIYDEGATGGGRDRPLPDIEGVHLAEGSETPQGRAVALTLPARSFTVVEAATTSR
jgi:hypothetical protein